MPSFCDYCRGPIAGAAYRGRPFPDRKAGAYCCYGCLSLGESERQADSKPRFKLDGFAVRLGIGILIAGQSMIFGLAINLEEQTPRLVKLGVQGAVLAGTLLVLALLGPPLFRNAIAEARKKRLTIEALFLLTMAGAMAASLQSFVTGRGPIYFEVVTVLLVVYSLGKAIGAHTRASALASAQQWSTSVSTCRLVERGGRTRDMEVGLILPGDRVEVRAGELIAVDGVIESGTGFVAESAVTGEPFAVVRRPGDSVLAGMASHDATFRIEATAPGTSRQIDRLLEAVENARTHPTSMQAQADRLGRIFFPLIMLTAIATFAGWTAFVGWERGLFNAMSVLLVACPCALGLATPIVLWSALNRLAVRGLIVHSGDLIERLAAVDEVFFDKTGTLTGDSFAIVDIATRATGTERARLLGLLALVEEHSRHPIARPFANLPKPFDDGVAPHIAKFSIVPGCGVEAIVNSSNRPEPSRVRIGRPEWLRSSDCDLLGQLRSNDGLRVDCELDGKIAAIAIVAERLRDTAPEAMHSLRGLRLPVEVITGDTGERAAALELTEAHGGMLPDDKLRMMRERKQAGRRPLMVGDGVNDAAALAAAHVGIALSSGTELANSAATATLYHGDLRVIPWAVALSRDATRTVRRNLWRAAGYNAVGIALAAGGVLHPVVAALLMVVSSLLVAWSSVQVGIAVPDCGCDDSIVSTPPTPAIDWTSGKAVVHALALGLQGVVLCYFLGLTGPTAFGVGASSLLLAAVTARHWARRPNLSHSLDMAYGMMTLGNMGMLLGWWADNRFERVHDVGCCACVAAVRDGMFQPGMWIGMALFANAAMAAFWRRPCAEVPGLRTAMFSGGNIGMFLGMFLGGFVADSRNWDSATSAAIASFAGMTAGMVVGMHFGTLFALSLIRSVGQRKSAPVEAEDQRYLTLT